MTMAGNKTVLIMAGGTGGHVYPALSVAEYLRAQGYGVRWLGTEKGLEARVVPARGFVIDFISSVGVRGKGILQKLQAPFTMAKGLWQAWRVLQQVKPVVVLGMGGFVSVPGGIAAFLLRKPLVIHEQNAVAGTANRLLHRLARRSLQAFPGALPGADTVGNPVRGEIAALYGTTTRRYLPSQPLRVLVLGGSLGAKAINDVLPELCQRLAVQENSDWQVWHQTGPATHAATLALYQQQGLTVDGEKVRVMPYIEDMAAAYRWADVMLCRAGAMTLAELTCAGLPALLVPLPNAIDDHQNKNAQSLAQQGAALIIDQSTLTAESLASALQTLRADPEHLQRMALASHRAAQVEATARVATACLQSADARNTTGVKHG